MIDVPKSNAFKKSHIVRSSSWNKLREAAMRLPEGNAGDIAVHDGTGWVVLSSPGEGRHVLSISGTTISWLATAECE